MQTAEAGGYFYNVSSVEEYKRKTQQLRDANREIMKEMHLTVQEASNLMAEISFAGYSNPLKTIRQMNSAAAATGLSMEEVKNYGISYGKQQWAQYGASKDASTELALEIISKYTKQQPLGSQAEMGLVDQLLNGNHMMQWGLTKWDPNTRTLGLDRDAINKMMGMTTMQQFQYASNKFGAISPNDMPAAWLQKDAIGPALMHTMDSNDLLKVSASGALEPIKMMMKALDPQGFNEAIRRGGDDPWGWVRYMQPERQMVVAQQLSRQYGQPIGAYMEMFEANKRPQTSRRGPQTMDEMDITNEQISGGSWWNLWQWKKYEDEEYTLGRVNTNRAGNIFNSTGLMDAVWSEWRANPDYKKNMKALQAELVAQRGGGIYKGREAYRFIEDMGRMSMGNFTAGDIQAYQDEYMYKIALLEGQTQDKAQRYASMFTPISELSDIMVKGLSSQYKTSGFSKQDQENIRAYNRAYNISAADPFGNSASPRLKEARRKILQETMNSSDTMIGLQTAFSGRPQKEIDAMLANTYNADTRSAFILQYSHLVGPETAREYLTPYEQSVDARMDEDMNQLAKQLSFKGDKRTEFGMLWNPINQGTASNRQIDEFVNKVLPRLPESQRLMFTARLRNSPEYGHLMENIPLANIAMNNYAKNAGATSMLGRMYQSSVPELWQGSRAQYYLGELSDSESNLWQTASNNPDLFAKQMTDSMISEAEAGGNKLTKTQITEIRGIARDMAMRATGNGEQGSRDLRDALKEMKQSLSADGNINATMQLVEGHLKEGLLPMSKSIKDASGGNYLKVVSYAPRNAKKVPANKTENA